MTKGRFIACAALLALAGALPLRAGEGRPDYPLPRVGVVRIEAIFDQLDYIREQRQRLEQAYAQDQAEIKRLQETIEARVAELRDNPLITPQSLRFQKEKLKIDEMRLDLEDRMRRFSSEVSKDRAEFYKSVYQQFQRAVNSYAQHYQLDLVITAPNPELSSEVEEADNPDRIQQEILMRRVQYLSPRVDITPQIIQMMNEEYQKRRSESGGGL
jgi:Skp family chaperone for outer membrane proteins